MHHSRTTQTCMLPCAIVSCVAAPTFYAAQPTFRLRRCLPPPAAPHLPLDIFIVLLGSFLPPFHNPNNNNHNDLSLRVDAAFSKNKLQGFSEKVILVS